MELLTTRTPAGMPVMVHGDMEDPLTLTLYVGGVVALLPRNVVHQLRQTFTHWLEASRAPEADR